MPIRLPPSTPKPDKQRATKPRRLSADSKARSTTPQRNDAPLQVAGQDEPLESGGPTLREILSDPWLRFNHLYHTKDKHGQRVPFKPWPEQTEVYWDMHYLNVVLKARQRGVTTAIQIFMLDACLFNSDINAGVIAHNREDAAKFFDDKIKFAYDNLPDALKAALPATSDNTNELSFNNGSGIRVGTSMRSGTLQYLHISEYGKICATNPPKAQEIRAGSLNTVAPGNFVFIESTAEGAHGHFYETCLEAEKLALEQRELTRLDYKFFFFPWWRAPEYVLQGNIQYENDDIDYFKELQENEGVTLTREQMNWYVKKKKEQGDHLMTQEYPSTPEEAFRGITEGAVFGKQLRKIRKERRICDVPVLDSAPVNTFWDIGRDTTSIWFHQRVGAQNRFIDYHSEPNQSLPYFARLLLQDRNERFHEYSYGTHYLPHDVEVTDLSNSENKTRRRVLEDKGIKPIRVVPRISVLEEGLEMTRQALASSWFDRKRCDKGIKCLENYRYEKNEKMETYSKQPLHNWASHGADSYRQFGQGYRYRPYSGPNPNDDNPLSRATRRRTRNDTTDYRV